jgi:hypothetical protein
LSRLVAAGWSGNVVSTPYNLYYFFHPTMTALLE